MQIFDNAIFWSPFQTGTSVHLYIYRLMHRVLFTIRLMQTHYHYCTLSKIREAALQRHLNDQ